MGEGEATRTLKNPAATLRNSYGRTRRNRAPRHSLVRSGSATLSGLAAPLLPDGPGTCAQHNRGLR